jgi:hypothetical protein
MEGFRRDAELHTSARCLHRRPGRPRRAPRIPLVLMFLRASR